jgi:beta-galactosidase/beta-glucuronidase
MSPLDQGYWPDGIYTAPTEEALVSDIELMKKSGFNMVRKHVKIEPLRWYYQCDKLGLLVWQDMPSGHDEIVPVKDHDHSIEGDFLAKKFNDVTRTAREEALFKDEWQAIIKQLYNFPSICMWVPFNESWGQFKTNEILKWTKSLDPTRLVDGHQAGLIEERATLMISTCMGVV